MSADFSGLEADFLRITTNTVFCTATTVGEDGRPRSRVLHPIFTPLRLEPWRVQVMRGEEYPQGKLTGTVWHRN